MKHARAAGWRSLLYVVVLTPFALTAHALADYARAEVIPLIGGMADGLAILLALYIAYDLFYAVWGLYLGYNSAAWDKWEQQENDRATEEARRILKGL